MHAGVHFVFRFTDKSVHLNTYVPSSFSHNHPSANYNKRVTNNLEFYQNSYIFAIVSRIIFVASSYDISRENSNGRPKVRVNTPFLLGISKSRPGTG